MRDGSGHLRRDSGSDRPLLRLRSHHHLSGHLQILTIMPSPRLLLLLLLLPLIVFAAAAHSNPSPSCNYLHGGDHHYHHDHAGHSPSCSFSGGDHHHQHHHHHHDHDRHDHGARRAKLPEELAEEEDLELYGFEFHHDHGHHEHHDGSDLEPSALGLWIPAMGCSLLVSLASLICLIILPVIFVNGKPSKAVVDSLAVFGAGAMLGDAFLHQLPHAFGGQHSYSHEHHLSGLHDHHEHGHSHAHSLKELSVGLSILCEFMKTVHSV